MTKYRVAEHKTIRAGGKEFLFLAAEKAIFEMDPPTRDLLARWSKAGERTCEEAMVWLVDLREEERAELIEGLLQRRAIVPAKGADPHGPYAHASEAEIPLKTLILHVTEACNLRCTYCYQTDAGERDASARR